jgi:two-component system response regulator LytT
MKVIIIEDEALAAADLADTLQALDRNLSIVRILASVKEAIPYLQTGPEVDLIFSDIQLGDGLSFDIYREVQIRQPVVFCTAFDAYAIEAFQNNGIDYILKPFNEAAVKAALDKYRGWKDHFSIRPVDYGALARRAVLVYRKDKIIPVRMEETAFFYIDYKVTRLVAFDGQTFVVDQTLDELEKAAVSFFRVNRQFLVNRKAVKSATHLFPRKYLVDLCVAFPESIMVSKNRASSFLEWLKQ